MRQGIGEVATLNIIIIFIVIVFGLLSATISYYKAFKINSRILDIIEKYEGYNSLAANEINRDLNTIGYTKKSETWSCPTRNGSNDLVAGQDKNISQTNNYYNHYYCVYYQRDDRGNADKNEKNLDNEPIYYNYTVVTYIFVDLPIIGEFKVPVKTKGERTYNFSEGVGNPATRRG